MIHGSVDERIPFRKCNYACVCILLLSPAASGVTIDARYIYVGVSVHEA